MAEFSRRGVLLGGGVALGAVAAGSPTRVVRASAAVVDAGLGAMDVRRLGDPTPFVTLTGLASRSTMQDVVLVPERGWLFITQAANGSNGARSPYESTVVNRVRVSDGAVLDSMGLVDGGHGLGFEAEARGDQIAIWTTWQGRNDDAGDEYDFVRLRYAPGTWTRADADIRLGLSKVAFQDRQAFSPEAVYHFDRARGAAVERHFHFPSGSEAPSETYFRRTLADLQSGSSATRGEITLPASPPLTQGFATVNGALFRLTGATATGDQQDPGDPIRLEQYSWSSGRLVGVKELPDLAKDSSGRWKDGILEPQGLSVYREDDGTASLLIGATTGDAGRREYHVLRFRGIGDA